MMCCRSAIEEKSAKIAFMDTKEKRKNATISKTEIFNYFKSF